MMSTKRQVSRHRQAIALPKREVRDPRFSSISGELNPHLHAQAYSFLPDLLKNEYHDLRRAVAAAQKIERTCPLREKEQRTAEREQLELDLGRLRTKMDRGKVETREREVLAQVKKAEREKRDEGKGAWYMKKGEKKDLLLKARFEALEQAGGKRAVKKAVDKKRKKVAGKEKKSRPDGVGGMDAKRRRVA
jgi:ribosomal RNA-processing protein 36